MADLINLDFINDLKHWICIDDHLLEVNMDVQRVVGIVDLNETRVIG